MNYQFKSCVLDLAKETDHDILEIAKKRGIIYPSQHLAIFKTIYAKIEEANLNGVRLSKEAVEKSIQTLVGKQVNLEHLRYGFICGVILDAWLNTDNEIEVAFTFFKDIYEEEYQRALAKLITGDLSVSFELNCPPDKQEMLSDGTIRLHEVTFGGMGLLIDSSPAYPKAKVFEMASRILNRLKMSTDLVMASQVQQGCINALKQAGVYHTSNDKLHYHFAAIDDMGNGVTLTITTDPSYDGDANHVHTIQDWKVMESSGHVHEIPAMVKEMPKMSEIEQAKKLRKKKRIMKYNYYACPYCEDEIKNMDELYYNSDTSEYYHKPCMNEGPIEMDEAVKSALETKEKSEDLSKTEGGQTVELTQEQKDLIAKNKAELGDFAKEFKDEDYLNDEKIKEARQTKSDAEKAQADVKKAEEDAAQKAKEDADKAEADAKQAEEDAKKAKEAADKVASETPEVIALKAENEQLKTKVTDLETQLKVKDESIAKIRQDAESLGKMKAELSTNPFVKEFKDEDYLNVEKVKNAKLQYENEQLKAKNGSLITAKEDDLLTGHLDDSQGTKETSPRLVVAKIGKRT